MQSYLSSEQISHVWTLFTPNTIREFAMKGRVPVTVWIDKEPGFSRDSNTIRAFVRLAREYTSATS